MWKRKKKLSRLKKKLFKSFNLIRSIQSKRRPTEYLNDLNLSRHQCENEEYKFLFFIFLFFRSFPK